MNRKVVDFVCGDVGEAGGGGKSSQHLDVVFPSQHVVNWLDEDGVVDERRPQKTVWMERWERAVGVGMGPSIIFQHLNVSRSQYQLIYVELS